MSLGAPLVTHHPVSLTCFSHNWLLSLHILRYVATWNLTRLTHLKTVIVVSPWSLNMFVFSNTAFCFLHLAQYVTTCLLLCLPLDLKHLEGSTYICFIHNVAQVAIQCQAPQFSSGAQSMGLFVTPWIAAHQASLSITNSWRLLRLISVESVMPSSHLILCCSLLLLPPIPPSIRVFSNESALRIRWPKYWSFSFSISPSNEHPGLISFKMDWLDLLAVQGTLKSLFQHHTSKASIFQCSAFFIVQLSRPYMTTGKTRALTRWTFVGKVMSLLFNILSRLVITFLPTSKHILISWL